MLREFLKFLKTEEINGENLFLRIIRIINEQEKVICNEIYKKPFFNKRTLKLHFKINNYCNYFSLLFPSYIYRECFDYYDYNKFVELNFKWLLICCEHDINNFELCFNRLNIDMISFNKELAKRFYKLENSYNFKKSKILEKKNKVSKKSTNI